MNTFKKNEIVLKGKVALKDYENLVFVSKNNRPIARQAVNQNIKSIVKTIQKDNPDFDHFSSHAFRHTFATRAIESGMNPKTLQKILGHARLDITMNLYCHVSEETLFEEMQKFERKNA